jgi:hypothetical protein
LWVEGQCAQNWYPTKTCQNYPQENYEWGETQDHCSDETYGGFDCTYPCKAKKYCGTCGSTCPGQYDLACVSCPKGKVGDGSRCLTTSPPPPPALTIDQCGANNYFSYNCADDNNYKNSWGITCDDMTNELDWYPEDTETRCKSDSPATEIGATHVVSCVRVKGRPGVIHHRHVLRDLQTQIRRIQIHRLITVSPTPGRGPAGLDRWKWMSPPVEYTF